MSYCRIGDDSDVYLILTGPGFVCNLRNGHTAWIANTREEVLNNLVSMKTRGYKIPQTAIEQLKREIASDNVSYKQVCYHCGNEFDEAEKCSICGAFEGRRYHET